MMEDTQRWKKKRRRLWLVLGLLVFLLAVAVMPPMVSISRYKGRIAQLMSESLGRPVRLGAVEMRVLPIPGFVLTDLTVEEDPAYGAEPVLRANTVTASIRLMSLWRGRLEISTISVDEASLNVVRTREGRWNLDAIFRTAATRSQPSAGGAHGNAAPLPYMEATSSRINFKQGAEKLPFSLVGTDLSFWQEQPGDWRIRLRGQPARTDLSLDLADTGVVRLEARAQRAPELHQMPVHLDLEWREAQLGQLARLLIGSDPGWRGDLTGEMHLDGTAMAGTIQTRLRATGVHREEFAPAAALDFDANCSLAYRIPERSVKDMICDSPLGNGRIRVAGELPGNGAPPNLSVELDKISIGVGLDGIRTLRSDFGPGLKATGSVSGKISYAEMAEAPSPGTAGSGKSRLRTSRPGRTHAAPSNPLTGSFTVDGFSLSGDGLETPIQAAKLVLEPAGPVAQGQTQAQAQGRALVSAPPPALQATVNVAAGGTVPLAMTARLALSGYEVSARGQASLARAKELAHVAGMRDAAALASLTGEPVVVDLTAQGPWLRPQIAEVDQTLQVAEAARTGGTPAPAPRAAADAGGKPTSHSVPEANAGVVPAADTVSGTVTLRNAEWKPDYLANPLEIEQATLHLGQGELRWDQVVFLYGPVKGTASLNLRERCDEGADCVPGFEAHFAELDASAFQAAILGAHEPGTVLSTLLDRLKGSSSSPALAWPAMEGKVSADSLILGPVTLTKASAMVKIVDAGAEIDDIDGDLLGGHVHGNCDLKTAGAQQASPSYALKGRFEKLDPAAVGSLLGQDWTGRELDADGKVELAGFIASDLAATAKGSLHFEWRRGGMEGTEQDSSAEGVSSPLARFDRWTADTIIGDGAVKLMENQVQQGPLKRTMEGTLTLGGPPKLSFSAAKEARAQR